MKYNTNLINKHSSSYSKQQLLIDNIILNDFLFFIIIVQSYLKFHKLTDIHSLNMCIILLNKFLIKYIHIFVSNKDYLNNTLPLVNLYNLQLFLWYISFLNYSIKSNANKLNVKQKLLLIKKVSRTRKKGRVKRYKIILILGNKTGWFGIGSSKDYYLQDAIIKARQKALNNIYYMPLYYSKLFKTSSICIRHNNKKLLLSNNVHKVTTNTNSTIKIIFDIIGMSHITSKIIGTVNIYDLIDLITQISYKS